MVYCQFDYNNEVHIVSVRSTAKDYLALPILTHSRIRHAYQNSLLSKTLHTPGRYGFRYYINK